MNKDLEMACAPVWYCMGVFVPVPRPKWKCNANGQTRGERREDREPEKKHAHRIADPHAVICHGCHCCQAQADMTGAAEPGTATAGAAGCCGLATRGSVCRGVAFKVSGQVWVGPPRHAEPSVAGASSAACSTVLFWDTYGHTHFRVQAWPWFPHFRFGNLRDMHRPSLGLWEPPPHIAQRRTWKRQNSRAKRLHADCVHDTCN